MRPAPCCGNTRRRPLPACRWGLDRVLLGQPGADILVLVQGHSQGAGCHAGGVGAVSASVVTEVRAAQWGMFVSITSATVRFKLTTVQNCRRRHHVDHLAAVGAVPGGGVSRPAPLKAALIGLCRRGADLLLPGPWLWQLLPVPGAAALPELAGLAPFGDCRHGGVSAPPPGETLLESFRPCHPVQRGGCSWHAGASPGARAATWPGMWPLWHWKSPLATGTGCSTSSPCGW